MASLSSFVQRLVGRSTGRDIVPTEKAYPPDLSPVGHGGWWGIIRESFPGAWQKNVEIKIDQVLSYTAVYRAITLISSDIGKLRVYLATVDDNNIWIENKGFSPYAAVLKKPNHYQNRIQFFMSWVKSKLVDGNTYVLKKRDKRGIVTSLYILDPSLVTPLVATNGDIYYQVQSDNLSIIRDPVVIPAKEIIHDRGVWIDHPLIGVSPIYACGLAATQGLNIQTNSTKFFAGGSRPGGVLTAPGTIDDVTAKRLKDYWESEYSGENVGKVAVLGDGLKYEPMTMTAVDAQLIDQLKWGAEMVAAAFGVPAFKIGVGPLPTYNNIEALDTQYFSQCLQIHIEQIELCLDEGLELPSDYGTVFDLEGLLRMDTSTAVRAAAQAIGAGFMSINEVRRRFDLKPVEGGETPYLQQQNYSLAALAERDKEHPLTKQAQQPALPPPTPPNGADSRPATVPNIGLDQNKLVSQIMLEAKKVLSSERNDKNKERLKKVLNEETVETLDGSSDGV